MFFVLFFGLHEVCSEVANAFAAAPLPLLPLTLCVQATLSALTSHLGASLVRRREIEQMHGGFMHSLGFGMGSEELISWLEGFELIFRSWMGGQHWRDMVDRMHNEVHRVPRAVTVRFLKENSFFFRGSRYLFVAFHKYMFAPDRAPGDGPSGGSHRGSAADRVQHWLRRGGRGHACVGGWYRCAVR
jgi:hypothetical protein